MASSSSSRTTSLNADLARQVRMLRSPSGSPSIARLQSCWDDDHWTNDLVLRNQIERLRDTWDH